MKYYVYLALAIVFEVFGTTMLKVSEGFTVLYPSLGVAAGFLISFVFLGFSLKGMPLSNAYAIWAGVGTAFTAIIGIVVFNEPIVFLKTVALLFVIVGVFILNKSRHYESEEQLPSL